MTGSELHQLLLEKWGCSYDVQLRRVRDRVFVQVMWRYLEQASFPLTRDQYLERLEGIAAYLREWGSSDRVREFVLQTRERPRLGKAVNISIDLGERASEWVL